MPFGSTPVTLTVLAANSWPVSAVYVPNTQGGNFTALQGGPASAADNQGNISAPVAIYVADGSDVTQGSSSDVSGANTVIGQLKQIRANTANITIGGGSITANQGGSWTVTANLGSTGGLALDASVNGILLPQSSATSGQRGPLIQAAVTTGSPSYAAGLTSPLSLTLAGALRVDASATTQPISGTIQPGNTANTTPWLVSVNQGGNTATVTSLTNSKALAVEIVDGSGTQITNFGGSNASVSATAASVPASATYMGGNKAGNLVGVSLDGSGNLNVNVAAGGASGGTSSSFGAAFPSTGTAIGASDGTNMQGLLVESSSNKNLRVGIYSGANEVTVTVSNALKVDGSAVTQPISAASLPLPSGAATSAKQPALGTAGAAATDVITVQGIASMTALRVDGSGVTQPVSGTITANIGTTNGLALDATLTGGNAQEKITDGTNIVNILKSDGTAAGQNAVLQSGTFLSTGTLTLTSGAPNTNWYDLANYPWISLEVLTNASAATLTFQTSGDASQTNIRNMNLMDSASATTAGTATTTTAAASYYGSRTGRYFRVSSNVAGGNTVTLIVTFYTLPGAMMTMGVTAAQSGTWTVQPGNTANTTAWKVDGSAVTQPVSGTVTANAGTNLNTSALALDTSVNGILLAQGSTTSGQSGPIMQGAVTTNAPSYTTAKTNPLSLDTSGLLRASLKDTPSNTNNFNVNIAASAVTVTVSGTVTANQGGSNWSTNVAQIGGTNVITGGANGLLAVAGPVASGGANADNPLKTGGVFNTTQPTVTNGQIVDLQATARGALIVATGVDAFAVNASQSGAPWSQNVTQFGGTNIATGTGASGSGIPRITVSNDSRIQTWDGTNGPVTVKAANISPTLADLPLVSVLSPNNTGLPVNLPTILQKTSNVSSGSVASLAKAFTSNNVQGNSIIVVCAVGNGTAPTISDTNSNVYTQAAQIPNGTAFNVALFYSVGPASGGGIAAGANTVTVNNGGTTASIAMEIYEVPGLITQIQAQPDQTATNTGTSGTASTGTISALSPNEYAFAAIGVGTAAQTITAGSGWTNDSGQQNPTTPAGLFSFISMSQFLGSLKAVTPQATFASEPWAIAVATFRPVILGIEGTTKLTDGTVTMAFGQNTMANSIPVVIASNQSAIPASQSGTWTVQPGNTANTTPWLVQTQAGTTGGTTPYHLISAASNNTTSVKGSAGLLYGYTISNSNASSRYVKFYDSSSAPTAGSGTPKHIVQIPGNGVVARVFVVGLVFSSGIGFDTTTGIADADTGTIGVSDLSIDLDYK